MIEVGTEEGGGVEYGGRGGSSCFEGCGKKFGIFFMSSKKTLDNFKVGRDVI